MPMIGRVRLGGETLLRCIAAGPDRTHYRPGPNHANRPHNLEGQPVVSVRSLTLLVASFPICRPTSVQGLRQLVRGDQELCYHWVSQSYCPRPSSPSLSWLPAPALHPAQSPPTCPTVPACAYRGCWSRLDHGPNRIQRTRADHGQQLHPSHFFAGTSSTRRT